VTPEQLAPYLKAEIESIPVKPGHPGIRGDQMWRAAWRAKMKFWRDNKNVG